MDYRKQEQFVELKEIDLRNPFETGHKDAIVESTTSELWSSQPQHLRSDASYERWMDLYDLLLCSVPVVLMGKIALCIAASYFDHGRSHGVVVDISSLLSYTLTLLNSQVGHFNTAITHITY
jgi:hypothetical protein